MRRGSRRDRGRGAEGISEGLATVVLAVNASSIGTNGGLGSAPQAAILLLNGNSAVELLSKYALIRGNIYLQ